MNFLYKDENGFNLMDQTSFEQVSLNAELVGEAANYLTENLQVKVVFFNDRAVGLEVPKSVNLRVTQTDPGFKGNTVSNTYKPATVETGYIVQVPLHIAEGDLLQDKHHRRGLRRARESQVATRLFCAYGQASRLARIPNRIERIANLSVVQRGRRPR